MRDINGLETSSESINGIVHRQQIMVADNTTDIDFVDEVYIDQLFKTDHYIPPNTRCIVHISLRYAWDSDICPDFSIDVDTSDRLTISSKQGLDDYPGPINTADMSFIVLDYSTVRIKLTKTMTDITKFKLYVHSFIKIDAI
jgi:hypothetical protein